VTVDAISVKFKGPSDPVGYDIAVAHVAEEAIDLIIEAQAYVDSEFNHAKVRVCFYATLGDDEKTLWAYWGRADKALDWLPTIQPKLLAYAKKHIPAEHPAALYKSIGDVIKISSAIPQFPVTVQGPMIGPDAKEDLWQYMKGKITSDLVQDQFLPLNAVQKAEVWEHVKQQIVTTSAPMLFPNLSYELASLLLYGVKYNFTPQQDLLQAIIHALESHPQLKQKIKSLLEQPY